jgi:hypothetical protein
MELHHLYLDQQFFMLAEAVVVHFNNQEVLQVEQVDKVEVV